MQSFSVAISDMCLERRLASAAAAAVASNRAGAVRAVCAQGLSGEGWFRPLEEGVIRLSLSCNSGRVTSDWNLLRVPGTNGCGRAALLSDVLCNDTL
jgi:hypothetical protein